MNDDGSILRPLQCRITTCLREPIIVANKRNALFIIDGICIATYIHFNKPIIQSADPYEDSRLCVYYNFVMQLLLISCDSLVGTNDDDTIKGLAGDDTLSGLAGDDTLEGGTGDDTLFGGTGADRLIGGEGADAMQGGGGNDTYIVDDEGDVIIEGSGQGNDTVRTSVDFTLSDNVENLVLKGGSDGTGNALNNVIKGAAGDNTINGGSGKDSLFGRAGSDTIAGGDDHDVIQGGFGDDQLVGGDGRDELVGGTGNDALDVDDGAGGDILRFAPGSGSDTVAGFDNSLLGDHDLIDVSAFGYTNFLDFTTGGG